MPKTSSLVSDGARFTTQVLESENTIFNHYSVYRNKVACLKDSKALSQWQCAGSKAMRCKSEEGGISNDQDVEGRQKAVIAVC